MVLRIFKNTTQNSVSLNDIDYTIPIDGEIDLAYYKSLEELADSNDLAIALGNGSLVLNIGGDEDIPYPRSVDIIRNIPQLFKTTADARLIVNPTPQPGTMTDFCLTSRTDGDSDGDLMHVDHIVYQEGDTQDIGNSCGLYVDNGSTHELSKYWLNTVYLQFDVLGNRTFFYDGGIMWRGLADNGQNGLMSISLQAVSSVFDPTDYETVPGAGNAVIVDGYLMVPYPGGNYNLPVGQNSIVTPQPFKMTATCPMVITGKYWAPAFWQIDYDLETQMFFNLQPCENPYAEIRNTTISSTVIRVFGNIFVTEIPLMSFVKDFLAIGNSSNFFSVASSDASEIGHGIRIRLDCKTIVTDLHTNVPWTLVGYIKTYREHTT